MRVFNSLALVAIALALPGQAQEPPSADTVVAKVGETEITLGHVISLRSQLPQNVQQLDDADLLPLLVELLLLQLAGEMAVVVRVAEVRLQGHSERKALPVMPRYGI